MSQRSKKKRQKTYHGIDAAPAQRVHHYEVGDESKWHEWWREHKQVVLLRTAQVLVVIIVAYLILKFV